MAKEQKSGLQDPFMKWGVGGAADAAAAITIPITALKAEITDLQKELIKNVANKDIKRLLTQTLAERKRDLSKLQREARTLVSDKNLQKTMQLELLHKMGAIRTQLMRKDLSQDILKQLLESEKKLERLYVTSKNLNMDNLEQMVKEVHESQLEMDKLPEEVADALAGNDKVLQMILDKQEESRQFLLDQKKAIKGLVKDVGKRLAGFGMNIADRLGFGPFTAGNALRGLGRAARGVRSAYRGAKYVGKTIQSIRSVSNTRDEGSGETSEGRQSLFDKFSEYVTHTKIFQRRMLKSADKKESTEKSLLGKLFDLAGVIRGAAAFLLGGGLIKYLGGLVTSAIAGLASLVTSAVGGLAAKLPALLKNAWELIKAGGGAAANAARTAASALPAASTLGAVALPAAAATALALLSKYEKERIEADPNDPEFKDNPYAMYLRGEATSVAQAGKLNQQKALTQIRPGREAQDYLDAGIIPKGYTKEDLENLAAGKAVKTKPASVGTGAQVANTVQSRMPNSGQDNPAVKANVEAMAADYLKATGKTLNVDEAVTASPTGALNFNNSSSQAGELRDLGLLKKYGFDTPNSSATSKPTTGGSPANATPEAQALPPTTPKVQSVIRVPQPQPQGQSYGKIGGTAQPSTRLGVMDIPTFDPLTGSMLALNLGILR